MHLDIDTNMKMIGKRSPYYAMFKVKIHSAITYYLLTPTFKMHHIQWLYCTDWLY